MTDPRSRPLRRGDLAPSPDQQLRAWFEEAKEEAVELPEATALATAASTGTPSVRMVLLKEIAADGLVFFTGYSSRKAAELEANPQAAVLFYWHALGRQARAEGRVERVDRHESEAYFRSRPIEARLAAAATPQGEVVLSRDELEARVADLAERHSDGDVPLPAHWGGYRLVPERYEFWQHRSGRLHDRFRYRRENEVWRIERLAP